MSAKAEREKRALEQAATDALLRMAEKRIPPAPWDEPALPPVYEPPDED